VYLPPPSSLPPGSIVDSYRRDSGGSRQEQSTDQQLTQITEYCTAHSLILRNNFADVAKSGASTTSRDDFNRMIDLYRLADQRPAGLLLWNYARFARDFDDAVYYKALLRTFKITVHSINDPIPEGDFGRIVEIFIDLSNEEKRRQTSADAKRGLRDLVQKYGCVPGVPPRGFKRGEPVTIGQHRDNTPRIGHRWIPDPELVPLVKKAFEMRAAGQTLAHIHRETHLYGSLNSYTTFFSNRLYIGILDFGDFSIPDYCPPLVDMPTWDAVQRLVTLHADLRAVAVSKRHPRRASAVYLLSGIIRCARCGSPLYGMTSKQRNAGYYHRYACTRARRRRDCDLIPIPARALEKHVLDKLHHFYENPDNLAELLEVDRLETQDRLKKQKAASRELQKQISILRRSIANLTSAIAESGHSKAMLAKLKTLESQETDLQSRLLQIKTQTPTDEHPYTAAEISVMADSLRELLDSKDPATVRSALLSIVFGIAMNREGKYAYGKITFNTRRPREPETDPDRETPTASLHQSSLGAQT
jgi:DNA invertase Pin-like site-specific DNA recombinase